MGSTRSVSAVLGLVAVACLAASPVAAQDPGAGTFAVTSDIDGTTTAILLAGDGTGQRVPWTAAEGPGRDPSWSRSGGQLSITFPLPDGGSAFTAIRPDGSVAWRNEHPGHATGHWLADNSFVAGHRTDSGTGEIERILTDGGSVQLRGPAGMIPFATAFASTGARVAVEWADAPPDPTRFALSVYDLPDWERHDVLLERILAPAWSPDGARLAAFTVEQPRRLIVIDPATSRYEVVGTTGQLLGSFLAWSGDGRRLLAVLYPGGGESPLVSVRADARDVDIAAPGPDAALILRDVGAPTIDAVDAPAEAGLIFGFLGGDSTFGRIAPDGITYDDLTAILPDGAQVDGGAFDGASLLHHEGSQLGLLDLTTFEDRIVATMEGDITGAAWNPTP